MDKFNFNKLLAYSLFLACSLSANSMILAEENTEYQFERLWPQLEQPWYFKSDFNVTAALDGSIFIQNRDPSRIRQFSGDGKLMQTWDDNDLLNSKLSDYYDTIAPDGSIYFNRYKYEKDDAEKHRILHFTSKGKFINSWGKTGSQEGEIGEESWINIGRNGHVYAYDPDLKQVSQFNAEGKFIRKWKGYYEKEKYSPRLRVIFAPDDSIYVSDCYNPIKHFSAEGDFIQKWQHQKYRNKDNNLLEILAISAKGDLYFRECLDEHFTNPPEHYYVHQFNMEGEFIQSWKDTVTRFRLSIGPNGALYFAEYSFGIRKFSENGMLPQIWASHGSETGKFNEPRDIAVAPDGSVYVADTDNNRIQQFDSEGKFIRMWGRLGSGDGEFKSPVKIAVAADNSVYVVDYHNDRIQQFNAEGIFVRAWGSKGLDKMKFVEGSDIAIAPDNTIYVMEKTNQRIRQYTLKGEFIRFFGEHKTGREHRSSKLGELDWPAGLAIDDNGSVYIADSDNQRIQQFNAEGKFIRAWTTFKRGYNDDLYPDDISIAQDGSLYVKCSGNLIQHYSAEGKFITSWLLDEGVEEGQFRGRRGMAIAPDGSLYIADTGNNRIQKFVLR